MIGFRGWLDFWPNLADIWDVSGTKNERGRFKLCDFGFVPYLTLNSANITYYTSKYGYDDKFYIAYKRKYFMIIEQVTL